MQTIHDYIAKHGLIMRYIRIPRRADGLTRGCPFHFSISIERVQSGGNLHVIYSTGAAHANKALDLADVLDRVKTDALAYLEHYNFDAFCTEYGYRVDNPATAEEATRTYNVVMRQSKAVEAFLTRPVLEELVYYIESF